MILADNPFDKFRIKKIQQSIEKQQAQDEAMRKLELSYDVVDEAWGSLLAKGVDDDVLYEYRCKLEGKLYGFD